MRDRKRAFDALFLRNPGRTSSMYSLRAESAASATGTTRSLLPFPKTRRKPASGSTFSSRSVTTSDARSPEAYMSESIALSRIPSGVARCRSGAARSEATWLTVRYFGSGRPSFGARTSAIGLAARRPSRTRNRKKERSAEMCLETERAESPPSRRDVR